MCAGFMQGVINQAFEHVLFVKLKYASEIYSNISIIIVRGGEAFIEIHTT